MGFPGNVKEDALVSCGRHCCICHRFCGIKIEVHHIIPVSNGGQDEPYNAIPLCFDCHADMLSYDPQHPKGNKYSQAELVRHRDNWYQKVAGNIGLADRDAIVETDKKIFAEFIRVLPWKRSIDFLRCNDFEVVFEPETKDLHKFQYLCKNPAFQFVDPDLEGMRVTVLESIIKFCDIYARNTFMIDAKGLREVQPELKYMDSKRFHEIVSSLHDSAQAIVHAYEQFVQHATRKLGVLPDGALDI